MRTRLELVGIVAVLAAFVGCGTTTAPRTPARAHDVPEAPAPIDGVEGAEEPVAAGPVFPRCGAAEGIELTSTSGLRAGDGALHHVVVVFRPEHGEWMPAEPVDMPMHHAIRLAWTNLDDFPELADASGERLRFTFSVLSQSRRQQPEEGEILVEYLARVEMLCSASAPSSRPEGARLASIGLDVSECPALAAAVASAARDVASCENDAQCAVVPFPACDLEGLGCYWAVVNRERPIAELTSALYLLEQHPCPVSDCDCPTPPSAARCRGGRCVAR